MTGAKTNVPGRFEAGDDREGLSALVVRLSKPGEPGEVAVSIEPHDPKKHSRAKPSIDPHTSACEPVRKAPNLRSAPARPPPFSPAG